MKKILFSFCILFIFSFLSKAEIVTTVRYKGKIYYVDVIKITNQSIVKAEVWFRLSDNASSLQDIKITELSAQSRTLKEYANLVCRGKSIVDAGKTILGCSSVIGAVFCATATIASDGALAFVCTTTWSYAVEYGAADCLQGAADAIATSLGKDKEWKLLGTAAQLADPKLLEAISSTIDFMCEDIKNRKD